MAPRPDGSRLGRRRRTIPGVIIPLAVTRPQSHQGTDNIRKIILLGADHSQDGSQADQRRRDSKNNVDGHHARLHDKEP